MNTELKTTHGEPAVLALSLEQAAKVSGLSRGTLYNQIAAGRLRAHKVGVRTLILTDDLAEMLRSSTVVQPRRRAVEVEGDKA